MRISDWSSDVCSSDLMRLARHRRQAAIAILRRGCRFERTRHGGADRDQPATARAQCIDLRADPGIERITLAVHTMLAQIIDAQRLERAGPDRQDRKSVVSGKGVSGGVDIVGRRLLKQKKEDK